MLSVHAIMLAKQHTARVNNILSAMQHVDVASFLAVSASWSLRCRCWTWFVRCV